MAGVRIDPNADWLPLRRVAPTVSLAGQLTPHDMATAARMGFRSVLNNRPDFEHDDEQPTTAEIAAACEALGLVYRFQPVPSEGHTDAQVAEFADHLNALPHPVLVFCRSGARSGRLWERARDRIVLPKPATDAAG